jgi:hypothetical protein
MTLIDLGHRSVTGCDHLVTRSDYPICPIFARSPMPAIARDAHDAHEQALPRRLALDDAHERALPRRLALDRDEFTSVDHQ